MCEIQLCVNCKTVVSDFRSAKHFKRFSDASFLTLAPDLRCSSRARLQKLRTPMLRGAVYHAVQGDSTFGSG